MVCTALHVGVCSTQLVLQKLNNLGDATLANTVVWFLPEEQIGKDSYIINTSIFCQSEHLSIVFSAHKMKGKKQKQNPTLISLSSG